MAPLQIRAVDSPAHNVTWGINGLVIVLALLSTALRFYTRIFTRAGIKADDWLILVSLVTALITAVLVLVGNAVDHNGLQMSLSTDPNYPYTPENRIYLRLSFTCTVLYFTVSGATKLGILLMYHRIFAISTAFKYQLWVSSALVIGWWFGCTVAALRKCQDLEIGLNSTLNDPRYCFDFNVFWLASGICEILLDVLILTLPISVIVRMRYSLKRKLVVSGIFLLGAFIIVTGIVKVYLAYTPGRRSLSYANAELWAALHSSMAILCASLPIFRPLVQRIANSSFITKCSSLLYRRRRGSSNSSEEGSRGNDKDDNNNGNRSMVLSFIVSEMVQNILKTPDPAHGGGPTEHHPSGRSPMKRIGEEDEQDLVPQLPRIDTAGDMVSSFNRETERVQHRNESNDSNRDLERG